MENSNTDSDSFIAALPLLDMEGLFRIFSANARERRDKVLEKNTRFVHYTNANAAMSILRNKEVWMRQSSCMNDYMEVEHGWECLRKAYKNHGKQFKSALNEISKDLGDEIEKYLEDWAPYFRLYTYLTCISEHHDEEDSIGRLSMWRAYGGGAGIAFVLKTARFLTPLLDDNLQANTFPVSYLGDNKFSEDFKKTIERIQENKEALRSLDNRLILSAAVEALRFAIVCTKHPGFREEHEWRMIYCPKYKESKYLVKDIQVIRGVPQPIYKIPLKNNPEAGLNGFEISEILDRIIIGPTDFPKAIRDAFKELLSEAGVADPEKKVCVSDMPLRR